MTVVLRINVSKTYTRRRAPLFLSGGDIISDPHYLLSNGFVTLLYRLVAYIGSGTAHRAR